MVQQLSHLGQFRYKIMYIPGKDNCWGDLFSRWRRTSGEANRRRVVSMKVRAVAVYARADTDFTLLSKNAIKASQSEVAFKGEQIENMRTMFGALEVGSENLYGTPRDRRHLLSIFK